MKDFARGRLRPNWLGSAVALATLVAALGCTSSAPSAHDDDHAGHEGHSHDHAHPTEGPHGGELIELGSEEYHAELVHDEMSDSVTIYLLDSAAKKKIAIEATELSVNLKLDGKGEQFKLVADPDSDDPAGKSSRFTSTDARLADQLHHEEGDAQLVVSIDGKQYRGAIAHDHSHDGHDH
ncbi:MAG: hypothetical protein ACIALR_07400 [Blastopirellula sp. JB062]